MKPLPWSYTALEDFINCPRSYYEKRVAKSVKEERSEQVIWGEKVHKHFEDRVKSGEKLPTDLAEHETFLARMAGMPGKKYTERKIALNKKAQPCEFFDKDVWFRGVIDFTAIHEDKALIMDYKTGKQHNKFQQLRLFALHTFAAYPEVQIIEGSFYWTKTASRTSETYFRYKTDEMWAAFIPNLKQYKQAFVEDVWQPRQSGLCKQWCPVLSCEFNGKSNRR
jgi:hypothetical protein